MTRKGNKKVRTGCLTCKARKVKCDEAKPWCNRCSSTGRTCEGYGFPTELTETDSDQPEPITHASQNHLFRPASLPTGEASESESLCLQYYYEVAAPFLAGSTGMHFWTKLVVQFSDSHPAVRHSVIAISSLYRQIQESPEPPGNAAIWESPLTLHHYNAAIRELKTAPMPHKQPLVLLVCVLFICIEFMQSNRETAIQHFKHGMLILENCKPEYSWASDYLVPVFRRMSPFPYFFGHGPADYPALTALLQTSWEPFRTLAEARDMMDEIFGRMLCLMRWGDEYKMGELRGQRIPKYLRDENAVLDSMLDVWKSFYDMLEPSLDVPISIYDESYSTTRSTEKDQQLHEVCTLQTRYETCRIMAAKALQFSEMIYDEQHSRWLRISEQLESMAVLRKMNDTSQPKFIFDMGVMPCVTFTLLKCRDLELRRRLWQIVPFLGYAQESLWDRKFIIAISRRVIELEHGARLDNHGELVEQPFWPTSPSEQRMEYLWGDAKPTIRIIYGKEIRGRAVGFLYRRDDGQHHMETEFLAEPVDMT